MDPGVWREDVWVTSSPHLVESRPVTGCLSINSVIWVDGSLPTPFTLSLEICLSHPGHKVKSGDHCAELVNFKFLAVMGLFWQVMASPPHQTCVKLASFGKTTLAQLNSDLSRKLGEMTGGIRENLNSSHHSSHPQSQTYLSPKTFITKWASELSIYPTTAINIRTPTYQLYVWLQFCSVDTLSCCVCLFPLKFCGEKKMSLEFRFNRHIHVLFHSV